MRQYLAGVLIFFSFLLTMIAYFFNSDYFIYSGIFAWLALILLFNSIVKKTLLYTLLVFSFCMIIFAFIQDFSFDFQRAILVNQHLLVLLIGVGFLRLIATPKAGKVKKLPTGESSFLKTYLGIHLFGSVINLSSLILVADKLYKKSPLSHLQIVLLTRGFSTDAFWSPFFVAFAAALTYAPNLNASLILVNGLVLAVLAFLITYAEVKRNEKFNLKAFQGYPIHFETLYIPLLLVLFVLSINHYMPELKVIILIALFSVILTLVILPLKSGLSKGTKKFRSHITDELPLMKNELALFLIAGVFGVSVSSLLLGYNIEVPFDTFNASSASILLLFFIVLAFIGIHPIITIAVIGSWMQEINHTLFATAFLMAWSITVASSPFSGLNLTIQARYNIKAIDIFKLNISYAIKMYLLCVVALFVLEPFTS